ncbi:DUF4407 domain-containing protein [Roseivirga misakiensis]|uniref:DUF4407 domain-containing protein n=1 Tax=Roseivirga misakiensis TaxID=1563681 RepID=A0A1E5T5G3_9BACT|nr:DUF4407 domain-containing protein [Roseivirga misakiensis]OEK06547.1 hypothetical protein BFP71_02430 [Roseivirga misakiensis]
MTSLKEFFWFCAGTNRSLLKRCPTDASKYTGMGAAVFFTGVLASLSGGYAFFTVFENTFWALTFGLVWGIIIFNLDRFIVSTMRKKKGGWFKELFIASPRILLAVMLAIVISKPLELKIFSKEIDRKLVLLEEEIFQKEISAIEERYEASGVALQNQITQLKDEINLKTATRNELADAARREADGTGGSMRRSAGPIYQLKKADADQAQKELDNVLNENKPIIQAKEQQYSVLLKSKQGELDQIKRTAWNGMAAQLEALRILGEENRAIFIANVFIMLLFIMLECTPIIVKLIAPRGPYDELLEIREHFYKNHNLEKIAEMDSETYEKLKFYAR